MTRCRVEQDELDYDTQQGQWAREKGEPSVFDYTDDIAALEPERKKRPDGTYTDGPSLEQFQNGMTFEMYQENLKRLNK